MEKARWSNNSNEFESSSKNEILEVLNEEEIDKEALFRIIPELRKADGFELSSPAHHLSVLDHSLEALKMVEDDTEKIALLLHDIGKPEYPRTSSGALVDEHLENGVDFHQEVGAEIAWPILHRILDDEEEMRDIYNIIALHDVWYNINSDIATNVAMTIPLEKIRPYFNVQKADLLAHEASFAEKKIPDLIAAQELILEKY